MQGILAEVGYVDALMVRDTPDGLQIIDGHLRAEVTPDTEVPVLVVDLSEEEARKVLATFDPLAAMAEADKDALGKLLYDLETDSDGLQEMLDGLARQNWVQPEGQEVNDPEAEWVGMPEFENEDQTAFQIIHVHFKSHEDVQVFGKAIGQGLTDKTRSIWFPPVRDTNDVAEQYVGPLDSDE
jgi:hypothetical protein